MSDATPPNAAASAGERGAEALSPEAIDAILADFRAWLLQAREIPPAEPDVQLDVTTIVQQFTALRQEVNLQTKASRAQLEQNAQALAALQEALEPTEETSDDTDELLRPLLKTLIDAHDALLLAEHEVQRLLEESTSSRQKDEAAPTINIKLPYWTRWLGLDTSIDAQLAPVRAWMGRQSHCATDEPDTRNRQAIDALLVGY